MLPSPPSVSANPRSQVAKVAFLLNDAEWGLFFPDGYSQAGVEVFSLQGTGVEESVPKLLRTVAPDVVVTSWSTPSFTPELLEDLPSLRYICHTSGSVRSLVPRGFLEAGGLVTNWGTLAADAVAEHALLLILSSLRRAPEWPPVIAGERPWMPSPIQTRTLFGKRVGLHGFGNVARSLVSLLQPFAAVVSAFSSGVPATDFERHGVEQSRSLGELFSGNDIVVECEALNPLTRGSVNRSILELLPAGGHFINVGRGAVVDEAALAQLASSGRIRTALDVFDTDPISRDSPLHAVEGIVMSPHIAGPTNDQFRCCGELARRNITDFLRGEPVVARVTLDIYDRAT
jgi:phosphoglycerate dehydrogenase-like enzyme